jgi:FkbM family methyltransferase
MRWAKLRRLARPAVRAVRLARVRVGRLLRPPSRWDGRHHDSLLHFEPWSGQADGRFLHDFLGVRTDPAFREEFEPQPPGPLETRYPTPSASYFELAFVLDAVLAAEERFTMVELGAGYGPWLVAASRAVSRRGGGVSRLVGVEMDAQHVRWMEQHFRNNGLDPAAHRLVHGAVSDRDGEAGYLPEPESRLRYGQRLLAGAAGRGAVRVPRVDVRRVLGPEPRIDLVHVDVQGEELRVLRRAVDLLDERVRRLLVATHSRALHRRARGLLRSRGWKIVHDFGHRSRQRTRFGDVYFVDGLLAFHNPRLGGG